MEKPRDTIFSRAAIPPASDRIKAGHDLANHRDHARSRGKGRADHDARFFQPVSLPATQYSSVPCTEVLDAP
jgi:hypothetical protein